MTLKSPKTLFIYILYEIYFLKLYYDNIMIDKYYDNHNQTSRITNRPEDKWNKIISRRVYILYINIGLLYNQKNINLSSVRYNIT